MAASVAFLLFTAADCATKPTEALLCVLAPAAMPASWDPSDRVRQHLSDAPWSSAESGDAAYAVKTGFDELQRFFSDRPAAVSALGPDAVESVIDSSYAASNMPALASAARDLARRNLMQLLTPYLARESATASCKEFSPLLTLTIHSHALLPADDSRTATMVAL